ncbi:MAG: DUF3768 domain-containing protein [Alphaproteobacteria bacterium]|nr:DUF3768 domain-containing protein [Alphaproteobacteria bacterium]
MTVEKTRQLNDKFRQTFNGGKVVFTRGVADLPLNEQLAIIGKVQNFNSFTKNNDPYGEHDFGAFDFGGTTYFWKIDYYDIDYHCLSQDPSDPTITNRVLTIMRADEY